MLAFDTFLFALPGLQFTGFGQKWMLLWYLQHPFFFVCARVNFVDDAFVSYQIQIRLESVLFCEIIPALLYQGFPTAKKHSH